MNPLLRRLLLPCALVPALLWAEEPDPAAKDIATIKESAKNYVEAFNKGDAKALAAQWAPDAVYTNHLTGERVTGRDAIALQFAEIFKTVKDAKLEIDVESVRLLSPNVAVEHGLAKIVAPGRDPVDTPYTAIHVRQEGQWLIDRVTDEIPEPVTSYSKLKSLEWMVGTWVDADDEAKVETQCGWTKNRNFLTRSFAAAIGDEIEMSGMQIIGWDPSTKQIRSWTFDSDGGFAHATWTEKNGQWFIHNHGVLPDGRKVTAVNVIKPIDANSFSWRTVERTVGGEILPNLKEVVITRQGAANQAPSTN